MAAPNPQIICTVDVPLFTLIGGKLHVVLLRRDHAPFNGMFALPGAYIQTTDENATAAAERMLLEKTGIVSPYLEELKTFSGHSRDPRGWSIAIAHYALVSADTLMGAATNALELRDIDDIGKLPFDHTEIVETAVARLRTKSVYSSLPCYLAGETFTLPELRGIYEQVIGENIDKITFTRKMSDMGMLEIVDGAKRKGASNRPGQLYRIRPEMSGLLPMLSRGMR